MLFSPKALGSRTLDPAALAQDKRTCLRVGPCGIGEKALYLNSFFFSRRYYVCYEDITRAFKRVAMTKGGFVQKGLFASMPYLVVEHSGGAVKQCNFKREEKVDQLLEEVGRRHPQIRLHSATAEKKLAAAEAAEKASYVKDLPQSEELLCHKLEVAKQHLEKRPSLYNRLSEAAREKRARENQKPGLLALATAMLLGAVACASVGVTALFTNRRKMGFYLLIFAVAFTFLVLASRILPIGRNSKKAATKRWEEAVQMMRLHTDVYENFPLPPRYAHPIVITRMIRAIRKGRAKTKDEALDVVKQDLKALNSSVRVTQQEYDEVVAVKPLFLVSNYE